MTKAIQLVFAISLAVVLSWAANRGINQRLKEDIDRRYLTDAVFDAFCKDDTELYPNDWAPPNTSTPTPPVQAPQTTEPNSQASPPTDSCRKLLKDNQNQLGALLIGDLQPNGDDPFFRVPLAPGVTMGVFRWNPAAPVPAEVEKRLRRFGDTVHTTDRLGTPLRRTPWFIARRVINGPIQFVTLVAFCWALFIALGNDGELRRERLGSAGLTFQAVRIDDPTTSPEAWRAIVALEVARRRRETLQRSALEKLRASVRQLAAPLISPRVWAVVLVVALWWLAPSIRAMVVGIGLPAWSLPVILLLVLLAAKGLHASQEAQNSTQDVANEWNLAYAREFLASGSIPEAEERVSTRVNEFLDDGDALWPLYDRLYWTMPQIGFMGTLYGMGITFEEGVDILRDGVEKSKEYQEMLFGLATAFDTTLFALVLAVVAVLLKGLVVDRAGSRVVEVKKLLAAENSSVESARLTTEVQS